MPILRVRTEAGEWVETIMNREAWGSRKTPPLTLGPGPESPTHIHLPLGSPSGTLIGSGVSLAYAYVLQSDALIVNGGVADGLRVLRHGDRLSMGRAEMHYLEFAVRLVDGDSGLAGQKCACATCTDVSLSKGDEYVLCPWCGKAYHAGCWMALEKCAGQPRGCYPIRRVLTAEFHDKLKIEKIPDAPESARMCRAGCEEVNPKGERLPAMEMKVGQDYLACPNPDCRVPYHVHCWWRMRGSCPACGLDFAGMFDSRLAGTDKGAFS